jgi:hypothetical protein
VVHAHDLTVGVQPHEVEREAHAERVHRPAARQMQGDAAVPPQRESDEAAEAVGDADLHTDVRRATGKLAP